MRSNRFVYPVTKIHASYCLWVVCVCIVFIIFMLVSPLIILLLLLLLMMILLLLFIHKCTFRCIRSYNSTTSTGCGFNLSENDRKETERRRKEYTDHISQWPDYTYCIEIYQGRRRNRHTKGSKGNQNRRKKLENAEKREESYALCKQRRQYEAG